MRDAAQHTSFALDDIQLKKDYNYKFDQLDHMNVNIIILSRGGVGYLANPQ